MVNYYQLGGDKCLNEIVVAGSHDAGITSGKKNVQTQNLNIFLQASVGVRFFDLRIAAAKAGGGPGDKRVELKAFHADGMLKKDEVKIRQVGGIGPMPVVRTKLRGGAFGIGLESMLQEAKDFVQSPAGNTEFLILKFDKCSNWMLIAEACTYVLNNVLYKEGGNLNIKTLRELRGKVVVLFSPKGVADVAGLFGPHDGILGFKNLYDNEGGANTYQDNFDGLQYFGKGGTSIMKPFKKMSQNVSKQGKVLQGAKAAAALQSPNLMAMMYWTSTGVFESIKSRDKEMWDPPNIYKMKRLWASGLSEFTEYRNPLTLPPDSPLIGPTRKRCMPNIVMIDFADQRRCQTIRDLNSLSPQDLAALGAA